MELACSIEYVDKLKNDIGIMFRFDKAALYELFENGLVEAEKI